MRRVLIGTATAAVAGSLLVAAPAQATAPTPIRTISGALTLFNSYRGTSLAVDPSGQIFVTMIDDAGATSRLAAFPAGSSGNVAPIILETQARIPNPEAVAFARRFVGVNRIQVDEVFVVSNSEQGKVYRREVNSGSPNLITVTASTPSALAQPSAIGVSAAGDWLVANSDPVAKVGGVYTNNRILSVPAATNATGSRAFSTVFTNEQAGLRSITDFAQSGSATFVADWYKQEVRVFDALGLGVPPARVITDANGFSSPSGIAVDSNGYIYVADKFNDRVSVFRPDANGSSTPALVLDVGVNDPDDVAIGVDNSVYVLNDTFGGPRSISVFGPLSFPAVDDSAQTPSQPSADSPSTTPPSGTGSGNSVGPSNESAPTIEGVSTVGATVAGTAGEWSSDVKTTYQWFRCKKASAASSKKPKGCKVIKKANKLKYQVVKKDKGKYLVLRVTAKGNKGTTVSYAASTAKVT